MSKRIIVFYLFAMLSWASIKAASDSRSLSIISNTAQSAAIKYEQATGTLIPENIILKRS
jgi:hypothetical protein